MKACLNDVQDARRVKGMEAQGGRKRCEAEAASWFTPGTRTAGGDRFALRKLEIPDHLTIE